MAHVLILDDDVQLCKALALVIQRMGHEAACAYSLRQGLTLVEEDSFEVVILDIRLPDGNGLDVLPQIKASHSSPEVIILSGSGDPEGAELAIRSGAWSYIPKPPTMTTIQLPVQRAIEYHHNKCSRLAPMILRRDGIVGESPVLLRCLEEVAKVAGSEANVLITGETGSGKELLARSIHENSSRAQGPFVVVDCAALPENLVESVLFGHERGAFTGADKRSQGLIRQAHRGTLFLDEVGELPLSMQKAFLRVLQTRRFRPVGGLQELDSDFRLVAATNKNLEELVAAWTFREDLLFRLRTLCIEAPPLRERKDDIPRLVQHFNERISLRLGLKPKQVSPELLEAMAGYDWPGNVRELASAVENAVTGAGQEPSLAPRHLPVNIRARLARTLLEQRPETSHGDPGAAAMENPAELPPLREYRQAALEELERDYLRRLLAATRGDIKAACARSGLSRARLYALLKQHGVARG